MLDEESENELDEKEEAKRKEQRDALEGLLNKLKQYLYAYYVPVHDPIEAQFHYTTNEIWQQLLKIFPNELLFTADMVATWLHAGGFTFYDFGEMKFEWLLKKA
jgi:hypothetical protein